MRRLFKRSGLAALAVAGGVLAPQAASAQAWIGQIAGDMAARAAEARQKSDCYAQTGSAVAIWSTNAPMVDARMRVFSWSVAKGDGKAVKALFSNRKGGGLQGVDGVVVAPQDVKLTVQGDPERVAVAFDWSGKFGRGYYTQTTGDPAMPTLYYTADFVNAWSVWKIWRVRVSTTMDEAASAPAAAYCFGVGDPPPLW